MRARTVRAQGESGATMVLLALVLLGLIAVAAVVVDIGGVYAARRNDQNAADSGALAAAFALPNRTTATSQAKQYVHDTMERTFSSTQWNSCTTDAVPTGYTKVSGSSCIAINGSARRVMVRIPEQQYGTGFGRVLGFDSLAHSAFAIAGLTPLGFGGVLPFGLVGQTSTFLCADSGGGNTGFCKSSGTGVSPGNFGVADFAFWGDDISGTDVNCQKNGQGPFNRIANNVAVGVDHDLEVHPNAPTGGQNGRKLDTGTPGACPGASASNAADTITGESLGDEVGYGLWSGLNFSDTGDARLQRLGTLPNTPSWMLESGRTTNVGGHDLDNIPLWEFIPATFTAADSVPRSCWRDQFVGADGTFGTSDDRGLLPTSVSNATLPLNDADRVVALMDRCFTHYGAADTGGPKSWSGGGVAVVFTPPEAPCAGTSFLTCGTATSFTTPVFSRNTAVESPLDLYDIQYTPRFAFVPKTTPPGGNQPRDFISFYTIYIQRILAGCNAGQGCNLSFDPGVGYSLPSPPNNVNGGLDAMAVFVFPHSNILPNGLAYEDAAFRDNANRTRSLVR